MKIKLIAMGWTAFALAGTATLAEAQVKLVRSTPTANAAVAKPTAITLAFDGPVAASGSTATLTMTGMPGMANHPDMKMPGVSSAVARDGRSLVLTSAKPLPAGTYRVDWSVVGRDKRRVAGKYSFSVR